MIALQIYDVFYGDVVECVGVVLIVDNMKFTITSTGKQSLFGVVGGTVRLGNVVYKAHVLHWKRRMWRCYSFLR